MTDKPQELDEILNKAMAVNIQNSVPLMPSSVKVVEVRLQYQEAIRRLILDWHNKQVEEIIKKPHILPKNAQHQESVKQGINFYHRQMRKRVDKSKKGKTYENTSDNRAEFCRGCTN